MKRASTLHTLTPPPGLKIEAEGFCACGADIKFGTAHGGIQVAVHASPSCEGYRKKSPAEFLAWLRYHQIRGAKA